MGKKYIQLIVISFLLLQAEISYSQNFMAMADTGQVFELSLEQLLDIEFSSVSKQEEKLADIPMSIYNLTKEEMDRWGVRYLYETIGRVPGYTFYNTDYYGQYGVMARGSQSIWRYGYSIELMPIRDFGHTAFPKEFFSGIEVARGPAGLAWGSGANAGLMNVNIRNDLDGVEIVSDGGNYGQYSLSALSGGKFDDDKGSFFIGVNQKGQDPETIENAFGQPGNNYKVNGLNASYSMLGKVDYKGMKGVFFFENPDHVAPQLWFENAYAKDSLGDWQPTPFADFWQAIKDSTGNDPHDQLRVISYRMEYDLPIPSDKFGINVYNNFYSKQWTLEAVATDGQQTSDIGFNANANLLNEKLKLSLGSDVFGRSINNRNSFNHHFAIQRGITWFNTLYAPSKLTYRNAFAQGTYELTDKIKLVAGTRFDYQDDGQFEDVITFYRGGAIYKLNEDNVVKYIYNTAPRRPQANERSQITPDAEILSAHELMFIGKVKDKLDYNVTLYHQKLNSQITRDPNTFNDFINTGGQETMGVEWGVKALPTSNLLVYWNGSALRPKAISGSVSNNTDKNSNGNPLFVPKLNSFLGAEYNIKGIVKLNVAWRAIYFIPYFDVNGEEQEASTDFFDVTLTTKKFWDRVELSFAALNILNNTDGLPAYGEHARNQNGTIAPEGMRFFVRARVNLPSKQ